MKGKWNTKLIVGTFLTLIMLATLPMAAAYGNSALKGTLDGLYDPNAEPYDTVEDGIPVSLAFTIHPVKRQIRLKITDVDVVTFTYNVTTSSDREAYIIQGTDDASQLQLVQGNFYLDGYAELVLTNLDTVESDIYYVSGTVSTTIADHLTTQVEADAESIPTTRWLPLLVEGSTPDGEAVALGTTVRQGPLTYGYWWEVTYEVGWWIFWTKDEIRFTAKHNNLQRIIEGMHQETTITIKIEWERYCNFWTGPYNPVYYNTPFYIGTTTGLGIFDFYIEMLTYGHTYYPAAGDFIDRVYQPEYPRGTDNWLLEAIKDSDPCIRMFFDWAEDYTSSTLPYDVQYYGNAVRTNYLDIYLAKKNEVLIQDHRLVFWDNGIPESGDRYREVRVYVKIPVNHYNYEMAPLVIVDSPKTGYGLIFDMIIHELR